MEVPLAALPVLNHDQTVSIITQPNLVQYEAMLKTADDSIEASMRLRAVRWQPESDNTISAMLWSVVETVAAITGEMAPVKLHSKQETVTWTSNALLKWNRRSVESVTEHNIPTGMDPATLTLCMQTVAKLTSAMGGEPRAGY